MPGRLRTLVLGGIAGCALMLAPEKADAQYFYSYPSYSYYSYPSYGYSSVYYGGYPTYGYSYYQPWRGSYYSGYRPWYGYRSSWGGWGRGGWGRGGWGGRGWGWGGFPRYSIQVGPFGYTRW